LGSGEFQQPDNSKYDLICTSVSVSEIINSNNLISRLVKVKDACEAILKYANGYIFEGPLEYLKNELTARITLSKGKLFDLIPLIPKLDSLSQEDIDFLTHETNKWYRFLDESFVSLITKDLKNDRKLILENRQDFLGIIKDPKVISKENKTIRKQILSILQTQYPNLHVGLVPEMNWNNIELYTNARIAYFHKLKLDETMNVDCNDAADLFQLVYVNKDCLYWTDEGSWKDVIRRAKMGYYLF